MSKFTTLYLTVCRFVIIAIFLVPKNETVKYEGMFSFVEEWITEYKTNESDFENTFSKFDTLVKRLSPNHIEDTSEIIHDYLDGNGATNAPTALIYGAKDYVSVSSKYTMYVAVDTSSNFRYLFGYDSLESDNAKKMVIAFDSTSAKLDKKSIAKFDKGVYMISLQNSKTVCDALKQNVDSSYYCFTPTGILIK